jgi:molecular chaperone DnaK
MGRAPSDASARKLAERLDEARYGGVDVSQATALVDRFRAENVLADVRRLATAAEVDPDAASTCENRLRDAQTLLDDVEAALEFPELVAKGRTVLAHTRDLVAQSGGTRHRTALHNAERTMEAAIASGDRTVVAGQIDVVHEIVREVLRDSGQLGAVIFAAREDRLRSDPDPRVQQLLHEGRRAMDTGDVGTLNSVNLQLEKIAPGAVDHPDATNPFGSTVTAGDW